MGDCRNCEGAQTCNSLHQSINVMYDRLKGMGLNTIFDRHLSQEPQCGFGMTGVCCQLCSHGPCRISAKSPVAICGATADTIVARNLLRLAAHGAAAYTHHLEQLAKTIKATVAGKTPFQISDNQKLKDIAALVGLDPALPPGELADRLADTILYELRKGSDEPLALVNLMAPKSRLQSWEKLGVVPGGVLSEIRDALTKSMSNIDTDPVDLLLTLVRLSIAAGYMGLVGTITLQDILLGSPALTNGEADLGVIDAETVNIVAHGHVPLMATAVLQAAQSEEMIALAEGAGAKGIKVYGSMCTGQELLQRSAGSSQGFAGQLGNWLTQEYYVGTGAVDLVMMDMNCSIPALKEVADRFHTKLVSVDRILRMPGVDTHVDFEPQKAGDQAKELIRMAVEAFKDRCQEEVIPPYKSAVMAGFGVESILGALGGSLDPLLGAIKQGAIKGVVAVVGCTNTRNGHDFKAVQMMRELIKQDILVISAGCTSSAAQIEGLMVPEAANQAGKNLQSVCQALGIPPVLNFGSCVDIGRIGVMVTVVANALGVDPSQLPVAASAPEYLEQKAVVDGVFAVAFGLLTHIGPVPPVTGSPLVTKLLTGDIESLTGGRVLVEEDTVKAAAAIVAHIEEKRAKLGI